MFLINFVGLVGENRPQKSLNARYLSYHDGTRNTELTLQLIATLCVHSSRQTQTSFAT
jgi:hypothetical protein